jgi:hypothetical protein
LPELRVRQILRGQWISDRTGLWRQPVPPLYQILNTVKQRCGHNTSTEVTNATASAASRRGGSSSRTRENPSGTTQAFHRVPRGFHAFWPTEN